MTTLRDIAQEHETTFQIGLGTLRTAPGIVTSMSLIVSHPYPETTIATLYARHLDPEGAFLETIDATSVLDRVGEAALEQALAALVFDSGIRAGIYSPNDLAIVAPQLLDC